MNSGAGSNPWARRDALIGQINAQIDRRTIDDLSDEVLKRSAPAAPRRLKGIYFDSDVALALDSLKKKRVNVSGFVNDAVRARLERSV
jgi:hypothetical protein